MSVHYIYVWTCYIHSKILHGAWGTGCVGHVSKLGPDDVAGTYASSPPNLNHPLEICSVCYWAGTQQALIVFSSNLAYFHAGCLLHMVWLLLNGGLLLQVFKCHTSHYEALRWLAVGETLGHVTARCQYWVTPQLAQLVGLGVKEMTWLVFTDGVNRVWQGKEDVFAVTDCIGISVEEWLTKNSNTGSLVHFSVASCYF